MQHHHHYHYVRLAQTVQTAVSMLDKKNWVGSKRIARAALISCYWSSGGGEGRGSQNSQAFMKISTAGCLVSTSFTFFILASPTRPGQPRHTSTQFSHISCRDGNHQNCQANQGKSGALLLVQIPPDTVLWLVDFYYAGAKVYAITTHLKACKMPSVLHSACL